MYWRRATENQGVRGNVTPPKHLCVLTPPRARITIEQIRGHIHDRIAQSKKCGSGQRLREKVGHVVLRPHERHSDLKALNTLTHKIMPPSDVLSSAVMLGII